MNAGSMYAWTIACEQLGDGWVDCRPHACMWISCVGFDGESSGEDVYS